MSGRKGQGFNRNTGHRAAGLGYDPAEDKQRGFGGQKIHGFSIQPQNKNAGKSTASHSAFATGLGFMGTSYREKMTQMTDQERMIEEKKRVIQMKFDQEKRKADEAAASQKNSKG